MCNDINFFFLKSAISKDRVHIYTRLLEMSHGGGGDDMAGERV